MDTAARRQQERYADARFRELSPYPPCRGWAPPCHLVATRSKAGVRSGTDRERRASDPKVLDRLKTGHRQGAQPALTAAEPDSRQT
jgi:hypothetical protein